MVKFLAAVVFVGTILVGWFALGAGLVLPGLDGVLWFAALVWLLGVLFSKN